MLPFTLSIWYHFRIYQAQLSLFLIIGIVIAILLYPTRETSGVYAAEFVYASFLYGEILVPPIIGWLASGLLLRDIFQEVVLTTPYSQTRLALERLFVLLVAALLTWFVFLLFIWQVAERPAMNLLKFGLVVLPVMLLFAALGLWSGLRLRTWVGGGFCVTLLWGSSLLFRQAWLSHPLSYPFLIYFIPEHPSWWANRLLLCMVSCVFIFDACRLLDNEELLLTAGREDAS